MSKPDLNKKIEGLKKALAQVTEKLALATEEGEKVKLQETVSKLTNQLKESEEILAKSGSSSTTTETKKGKISVEDAKTQLAIMDKYKCDEIYKNSQGAYFTSRNLAELSVKDKKEVKTLTREFVESQLK